MELKRGSESLEGSFRRLLASAAVLAAGLNLAACWAPSRGQAAESPSPSTTAESEATYTDDLVPTGRWRHDPANSSRFWTCLDKEQKVQVSLDSRDGDPDASVSRDPLNCSAAVSRAVIWQAGPDGQQQACLNETFVVSVFGDQLDNTGQPHITVTKTDSCHN